MRGGNGRKRFALLGLRGRMLALARAVGQANDDCTKVVEIRGLSAKRGVCASAAGFLKRPARGEDYMPRGLPF